MRRLSTAIWRWMRMRSRCRVCEVMQPVKQLIAFRKVLLQPGEEQEVTFHLDRTAFTYINRAEERVFAPGDFMLMAGHSAKDEDLLKETVWVG